MKVQVKQNHRVNGKYQWEEHEVEANDLQEAAYKIMRQLYEFLTDENHFRRVEKNEKNNS